MRQRTDYTNTIRSGKLDTVFKLLPRDLRCGAIKLLAAWDVYAAHRAEEVNEYAVKKEVFIPAGQDTNSGH